MASAEANPPVAGRSRRATPDLLKNLRRLRIAVFHPPDADGEMLTRQLQRIGCQTMSFWPPLPDLPDTVDLVFCAVRPEHDLGSFNWAQCESPPGVVAVINYENPTIVDAVLKLGAHGVLCSPLRSSGILSSLVLALSINDEAREARKRVARLEQKLQSANEISDAKQIVMRTHGVGDGEAYRILREQAMSKRVGVEEIARAIILADSLLSFGESKRPPR